MVILTVWPENLAGIKFGGLLHMALYKNLADFNLAVCNIIADLVYLRAEPVPRDVMLCACYSAKQTYAARMRTSLVR